MRSLLLVIGALLAMGISGFVGFLVGATGGSLAGTLGGVNLGICESLSVARRRQYITQMEAQGLLNAVLEDSNFYRNNAHRKVARETLTDCILKKLATAESAPPTQPQPTTTMNPNN
ncbi:hypothetical protein ACN4EK_29060 [Pantanalinema rosaneae CENA516]|uniref:hypothetical protein n=1 Tax=Pantanalinema rosaneae TaxID=1620701 RepID=UPI003D6ECBBB